MPRGKVNRRLDDAERIRLFAEYHIEKVRFAKGGISAVKHTAYGWITPKQYYALQKLHDLMPLLQEFIRGGYQAKAWIWGLSAEFTVLGTSVSIPFGATIAATEYFNFLTELYRTKTVHVEEKSIYHPGVGPHFDRSGHTYSWDTPPYTEVIPAHDDVVSDIHWDMLALRTYALLGPFGDVIQLADTITTAAGAPGQILQVTGHMLDDVINGFVGFWKKALGQD